VNHLCPTVMAFLLTAFLGNAEHHTVRDRELTTSVSLLFSPASYKATRDSINESLSHPEVPPLSTIVGLSLHLLNTHSGG
jgi:hypothetical protein